MEEKEVKNVYAIPANYTDSGKLLGGMIETRNAVETGILLLVEGYPELKWIPMPGTSQAKDFLQVESVQGGFRVLRDNLSVIGHIHRKAVAFLILHIHCRNLTLRAYQFTHKINCLKFRIGSACRLSVHRFSYSSRHPDSSNGDKSL